MTDVLVFFFFFRLVNSLSKMYLKSDVPLLPSTPLPNCLPSHHPRSLPKCNTPFMHNIATYAQRFYLDFQFPKSFPLGFGLLFPDTQLVALDTNVDGESFVKYPDDPDCSRFIAGKGVCSEEGMYSFSPTTAFETSFVALLNTRSANAATVHTPPKSNTILISSFLSLSRFWKKKKRKKKKD